MSVVRPIDCVNCSKRIGNLEPAFVHQNSSVCEKCYRELTGKPKGFSFFGFLIKLLILVAVAGAGVCGYGYYFDNAELGGYGLFAAGGAVALIILLTILRIFKRM